MRLPLKTKLSFAWWLLIALVAINLAGAAVIFVGTTITEGVQHDDERMTRLRRATEMLREPIRRGINLASTPEQRARRLTNLLPVVYSNPDLDVFALVTPSGDWTQTAWVRGLGQNGLQTIVTQNQIKQLIATPREPQIFGDYLFYARAIQRDLGDNQREHAEYMITGQNHTHTLAETLLHTRKLAVWMGSVLLLQALVVAVFLNFKLRRPLARITSKTAEVELEHADVARELSDLGELQRIERAAELLGTSLVEYKDQDDRLRSILATIKESILVLDDKMIIREVNQGFVATWGYAPDEIIGKPLKTIFHSRHHQGYEADLAEFFATGVAKFADVAMKISAVDMNGREFPISLIFSECVLSHTRVFVMTVTDISEQERHSQELIEAKEKAEHAQHLAEQAAAAKAVFLANMSHEIRTPMNGVMGLLDLVADTELDSHQRGMVKTAKTSAESLLNVLNDILDISKIEAGKVDLERTEFDIKNVFEEVVMLFHISAAEKGLELSCFVDPQIQTTLKGDPTRLRQVLSNVVGNAVKFTPCGEVEVRLDVTKIDDDRLDLHISVRDTGIGMSKNALETLFDQFSQADESTTRKFGGTGLGMAISKQLVELMGGSISATSNVDEGTTFHVNLSLPKTNRLIMGGVDKTLLPKIRALVVDDNQTNREILCAYLSNWDIEYQSVSSGEEALQLISSEPVAFDICLLDYHMPFMDGIEVANIVREKSVMPQMKIALLSSGMAESNRLKEAGITESLNKPIRQTELFELIARCVNVALKEEKPVEVASEPVSGHVLLVEDNKVNQLVARSMLEKLGITVDVAEDGVKGLEAMAANDYDLVFMDCLMPVMDGYEATEKRRELERETGLDRVPVVALTANAMSGDREKCLNAGMDDFLSKPVKLDDLSEILGHWLSERSPS